LHDCDQATDGPVDHTKETCMRIPGAPDILLRTFAVAGLALAASLAGCAKTVNLKPEGSYLGLGSYRSQTTAAAGGRQYRLELKRDGSYALKAYASGCLVRDERGRWSGSEEYLDLTARETHAREACAAPLVSATRVETYSCPIRKLSDRTFQMIHEEIDQGTRWTEWTLATTGDLVESNPMPGERNLSAAR
jgi:hypothetical protein